jgi:hypothetical protein
VLRMTRTSVNPAGKPAKRAQRERSCLAPVEPPGDTPDQRHSPANPQPR